MRESRPIAPGGKLSLVNPQWHDEFVILCSLPVAELTEEEWALLQVHLAYCDSCRIVFEQYQQLADNVMPALAAAAYLESKPEPASFSMEAAERRLLRALDAAPVTDPSTAPRKTSWKPYVWLIAACLVGIACLVGFRLTHPSHSSHMATAVPSAALPIVRGALKPSSSQTSDRAPQPELVAAQHEIAQLQDQLNAAEARSRESVSAAASAKGQLEAEQAQLVKIIADRDAVNQQLAAVRAESQTLRETASASSAVAAQQANRASVLEAKLKELNVASQEKDRMLSVDKEFLAHDRDIRDLIAARDLYIADIYDVAQNGKTAKPFGRIFYTKDRSLVFYGYDLDKQAGLKQAVAFQAWGSGDDKKEVSLGLFYQDDKNKRWVLQFNDTKTLARLNMVFVTAEPQGGSAKPTGKPLLLAYLQVQPNHP